MTANIQANLELSLKTLRLPMFLKLYQKIGQDVITDNLSSEQYLYRLVQAEVESRRTRKIQTLLKYARFPTDKRLDQFDFSCLPNINQQVITELSHGHFLSSAVNIIFLGPPGIGKTHLAIAVGRQLCLNGFKVRYYPCCELIQDLCKAKRDLSLSQFFFKLSKIDLVIIDELGFTPIERNEAELLFQFISNRYERKSIMLTTNLVFSEWDKIFLDKMATSATIDRIIHHCEIFEFLDVDSFRAAEATKKQKNRLQGTKH